MKHTRLRARNFASVLKRRRSAPHPAPPQLNDPVAVLVMSLLMWETTTAKAAAAYKRIMDRIVDFNDLRVSMPHEVVGLIGSRYPLALQRCQRLRAVLRDTYNREHAMSLKRLHTVGKREIKAYVRSLDGIVPYVADRVMLLCFDTHCIPVDDRLRRALVKAQACDDSVQISELASWLARQVKAADAPATHSTLQALADRLPTAAAAPAPARSSARGSTAKDAKAITPSRKMSARSRTG
ncbi:MAG: hypothetical protein O7F17_04510 [Planctomycetota bacterium]|nr:hypothetical protein [Planctomycetota bacterium]